jgi:acetolactate synthase-1/2/3 large subunit
MPGTIVQVDVDPETVGRNYPGRTLPIVGDVRETLRALLPMLEALDDGIGASRRERLAELSTMRTEWWAEVRRAVAPERSPASPVDIVLETRRGAPDDTVAFVDAGNPGVWAYLWEIRSIRSFHKPVGFGNMGFALPAAIASAVSEPERPAVVLIGDGSLGMSLAELETLARVGGRVVVVVMNDSGYGNIRQEQTVFHGANRHVGVDFLEVDFAQVARGLGLRAERIDRVEGLADHVAAKLADGGGPALIDVVMDPVESAWTYPPFRIKP